MKKSLFILSIILVSFTGQAEAQSVQPAESKRPNMNNFGWLEHGLRGPEDAAKLPKSPQDVPDNTPKRPFDVLSYKVNLDWRAPFKNKNQLFSATNEIALTVTQPTDSILLDAAEMQIDSCWVNGTKLPAPPQPNASFQLGVPLPSDLRIAGSQVTIKFAYTRTSAQNDGMNFYPQGLLVGVARDNDGNIINDTVAEDVAYTMSEPLDAHKWMPCMDLPYDKANSQISITVPAGITAQSNGSLLGVVNNSDGSSTYDWQSDEPISTYLMVADASNFSTWRDYYHRISDPNDSVPVVYYSWPVDSTSTLTTNPVTGRPMYNAASAFVRTPQMLKAFSARFGEYPFVKYAQVPVQPFGYGGMEHQSITTINRSWLNGYSETGGVSHELMHQWFGDKTTCETWSDIWLNESFATHGEGIWAETVGGKAAYDNWMAWKAVGYFQGSDNTIPVYDPPLSLVFNYATVYCKGGCVLYMLRNVVNDDTLYFDAFRDYSAKFAYTTANTAQWVDFMSHRLGIDLTEYADEWIYNGGHPIYDITWGQGAKNTLAILVTQQQAVRDHFTMPMTFIVHHSGVHDTLRVQDNQRVQQFTFNYPDRVDSLDFDSSSVVVSLHTTTHDSRLSVNPLPATDASLKLMLETTPSAIECRFLPLTEDGTLSLYDMLGQKLREVPVSMGSTNFQLSTQHLPSSTYLVCLRTSSSTAVERIGIVR